MRDIDLLIFVLWWSGRVRQNDLFRSRWDFSRSNKHDTFWRVVPTGYFYVLFVSTIAASDLHPLEIYKNLKYILVYFNFWVSSHADNHFCKSIYLFQILYIMKSAFLVKYTLRILTGKKHCKIKFQRLWKIQIWTFGSLVHQINSF